MVNHDKRAEGPEDVLAPLTRPGRSEHNIRAEAHFRRALEYFEAERQLRVRRRSWLRRLLGAGWQ